MRHTSYFLIAPKSSLTQRLEHNHAPNLLDLNLPVVWSGEESDKSILSPNDYDSMVKILFLDVLNRERNHENGFDSAFYDYSLSEQYFDTLWTILRIPLDMSVEFAIKDSLASGTFDAVKTAGNSRVKTWLTPMPLPLSE